MSLAPGHPGKPRTLQGDELEQAPEDGAAQRKGGVGEDEGGEESHASLSVQAPAGFQVVEITVDEAQQFEHFDARKHGLAASG